MAQSSLPANVLSWSLDLEKVRAFVVAVEKAGLITSDPYPVMGTRKRVTLSYGLDRRVLVLSRRPEWLHEFCTGLKKLEIDHPVRKAAQEVSKRGIGVTKDLTVAIEKTKEGGIKLRLQLPKSMPQRMPIMELFS